MNRREFSKSVALLPITPALTSSQDESETGSEFWELSASWFSGSEHGELLLVRNDEEFRQWSYDDYEEWRKVTLLNTQFVTEKDYRNTDYVADLFDLDLSDMYVDPPYFSTVFTSEDTEVHIREGMYSEQEYVYSIETHDEDALRGIDGGAESLDEVVKEVGEFINNG